jgi:hypothetical protein
MVKTFQNIPLTINNNTPLELEGHYRHGQRRYSSGKREEIRKLATKNHEHTGRGIKYFDLMQAGITRHKQHAQDVLKYYRERNFLFTLSDQRPQEYYLTEIKSKVMKNKLRNITPISPTGVSRLISSHLQHHNCLTSNISSNAPFSNCFEASVIQTFEGYVLPLLPSAPLFIHNMHFKLNIPTECYSELKLVAVPGNSGKRHFEVIGTTRVDYTFYPSGILNVETRCSNNPFKLETETDRSRLFTFFGQLKQALITFLMDKHERLVPDIMEWYLTECDINKDIKVSDWFHYTSIKIQVKHLDHLFKVYIKEMGKDTVWRVEESKAFTAKKSAIEVINNIFNPNEKLENQNTELNKKVDRLLMLVTGRVGLDFSDKVMNGNGAQN